MGILIQAHLASFWLRGIMAKEKKNLHAHWCVLTCIKEKGGSQKHQASKQACKKALGWILFLL